MNNMNNQKKKKNTKKEFSDSINIDDHTFQTVHMENKLKQIKRRKKVKNNFKNMETFETLKNTFENDIIENKNKNEKDNIESFNNIVEGLDIDIEDTENRDTYEGHDDVDEPESTSFDWKKELKKAINYTYDTTQDAINTLSENTTDALSNGKATEKDKELLYKFISTIIAALASYPVTYNWYFLMFYLQDMTDISLPHLSVEQLKIDTTITDPEQLKEKWYVGMLSLFLWFYEFALIFPANLDWFLTIFLPPLVNNFLDGKVKFIVLFFTIFTIMRTAMSQIKDFFISIIDESSSNWVINVMFAIVFLMFFVSFARSLMEPGVRQSYENAWFILLPLLFIRFIVVIILSVPFAGALCFLYLFFYSFFATVIYKPKVDSFYDLYSKISYHINHSKIDKPPRSCDGESLFSKLLRIIVNIVGVFKDNVLEILIIFICISFYNAIQTDMSDVEGIIPGFQMKECFTFLFFIFAIYGATKMYLKLIPEFKRIFIEGVED